MKAPNLFKRKKNEINFAHLREMMNYYPQAESMIDDVTWQDLTMDDIYVEMEETLTAQGDEALYYSLHTPLFDPQALAARSAQISALNKDPLERENLRNDLKKTGRLRYDFRRSIQEDFQLSTKERLMYLIGPLTTIALTVLMIATQAWNIGLFIFISIIFNGSLHFKFTKKYEAQIDTLSYTYKLLNFCAKYQKKDFFKSYSLAEPYAEIRKAHKDISFIFQLESLDFLADYLNILFLIKERRYVKVAKRLAPQANVLFQLYEIVGQMDMHQGMSRFFAENKKTICTPELLANDQKTITFKELIHPLLKNPISNDLEIHSPLVITGSNMSGKSTFLRTIGVNVLLAQTWNFAYASEFSLCPLHIITSISLQDNLSEGKSYFLQEADAIRRMLEQSNRQHCTLFLIDEIFKGTNPVERIASATEICLALANANTLGLVATHDLQLIPQIPNYLPYYFTENVTKEDLSFDYKIHPGITTTRNAVKILEYLKYDPALIHKINQRIAANEMLKN
ncbi:hypothetical protein EII17_05915 [Clostridiales bacterium COT073_COT-073]|nr:hypothetical protein EII17_05915 [Clostridiales bacterium COT073_COT-073]